MGGGIGNCVRTWNCSCAKVSLVADGTHSTTPPNYLLRIGFDSHLSCLLKASPVLSHNGFALTGSLVGSGPHSLEPWEASRPPTLHSYTQKSILLWIFLQGHPQDRRDQRMLGRCISFTQAGLINAFLTRCQRKTWGEGYFENQGNEGSQRPWPLRRMNLSTVDGGWHPGLSLGATL
jgi:hypothetical protein